MRVLAVLVLLCAAGYGRGEEDACSVLHLATPDRLEDRIVVVVKDNADESVSEVREGNTVYVTVTIPPTYTATSVDCLLGLGLGHSWRRMMAGACRTAPVTEGGATCVFSVTDVNASPDLAQERLDVRIGIKHSTGYLRSTYEGNPFSFIHEQKDRQPVAPNPTTTTPKPVVIVEQVKAEDPHDSKMEAYLAAKWAEQQQQMADDEDKNSEGTWQRLEENEKRQHEADMQKELQEYEARTAEEKRRQEEMIRQEMLDKEENEELNEAGGEAGPQVVPIAKRPEQWSHEVQEEVVVRDGSNGIEIESAAGHNLLPALVLIVSTMLAVILL